MSNGPFRAELISPIDSSSPMYELYKKHKNMPYHICYECEDIERTVKEMTETAGECMTVQAPDIAPAVSEPGKDRRVAFLMHRHVGLLELLEV